MNGHLKPCVKECQFSISGICCNGGWNATGKCHLDFLAEQEESRKSDPKHVKGRRVRFKSDFQEVYERWWLGKKCRLPNGEVKKISEIELVGPPSFVYGTVFLHFSDGTDRHVSCEGAYRPRKKDVEIVE